MGKSVNEDGQHRLIAAARKILHDAGASWDTIIGTLHSYSDENVRDLGRERSVPEQTRERPGAGGQMVDCRTQDRAIDIAEGPRHVEGEYRFFANRSPWRLRIERVRETVPADEDCVPSPDVLILHRKRWWDIAGKTVDSGAISPDKLISRGSGTPRWMVYDDEIEPYVEDDYSFISGGNLGLLLRPSPLARAFAISAAMETVAGGRRAIRVRAAPREPFSAFVRAAEGLVTSGASRYVMTIDASAGIVLAWKALIDGRIAARQELSYVRVDVSLDPDLFSPPSGA